MIGFGMLREMDKECIALCEAMNRFKGIQTTESCCGHGKSNYHIFFNAENLECLPPLLYYFAGCHCGFYNWNIIIETGTMNPVYFVAEGPVSAYNEAESIAKLLNEHIDKQNKGE